MTALAFAAVLLPLICASPARAQSGGGSWVLDPVASTVSGTAGGSYTGPDGTPWSGGWDIDDWDDFIWGGYNNMGTGTYWESGAGSASATIDATQTFVFRWEDGNGNPAPDPPKKQSFLVTGLAAISYADTGSEMPYDANFPSGLLSGAMGGLQVSDPDDGFGDKPVTTTLLDTDPDSVYGPRWGSIQKTSSSPGHLVQKDSSSGTVTITVTGSAAASGSVSSPKEQMVTDFVDAYINPVAVVTSDRAVTISSDIEESHYKGAYDAEHGTDTYIHQRNNDGTMSVDAGVSWNNASTTGWIGSGQFTAIASGFNNPTYAWSASGGTVLVPPSHIGYDEQSIPISIKVADSVSGFPAQSTIKVDVTGDPGSDGVTGSASYSVNWHLPYEKNQDLGTTYTKKTLEERCGPIPPGQPLLVRKSSAQTIDVSAAIDAVTVVLPMVGASEKVVGLAELVGKLAGITKWEYDFAGEDAYSGGLNTPGSGNWGFAVGDMNEKYKGADNISPASLAGDPNNEGLCDLYIRVVEKDKNQSWYADGYNAHGYDGNSQHIISTTQVDMIEDQPFFVQYKNPDGSPYEGP